MFVLISLTCVNAADDNQTDIVTIESDKIIEELSAGDAGNFTDLQNDIQTAGDVLVLEKDYTYNPDQDQDMSMGIEIKKSNFVIDGQGHTLDASGGDIRIFDVNANNVVLKNIIFTNASGYGAGGGIYSDNYLTIDNCTFINIRTNQNGGVLYLADGGLVNNSKFLNNGKGNGAAIYFKTSDATVLNSVFTGNDAYEDGGAIYFEEQGTVDKCNFTNNIASYDGGAIFANGKVTVSNSNFNDNKARFADGGAIYFNNGGAVNNCNFTGNNATYKTSPSDGGAILSHGTVTINGSNFENNYADNGGAILSYGTLILENSTFKDNTATNGLNNISLLGNGQLTTVNVTPENLGPFKLSSLDITNVTTPVTSGTTVNITVNVTSGGKKVERGTVYVIIYNVKYSANVENGKAVISLDGFNTVGKFKETVFYDDDDIYYAKSSMDAEFEILKNGISFDTNVTGAVHKQPFNITVQVKNNDEIFTNGNVSIIVNNTKYNATIIDGYAKFFNIPGLTAGTHDLLAMFDNETLSASEKVSFTVGKKKVDLIFDVPAIIYCGEVVTIPVQVVDSEEIVNEGQVEFELNMNKDGTTYVKHLYGDVINGMANVELPIFEDEYTCYIRAEYNGDFFVHRQMVRKDFKTLIADGNLTVNATNVTYGDVVKVNVTLNVEDVIINTGNVSVTIGNDNYYGNVVNGSALVEIPELNAGTYTGTVKYNGAFTLPEESVTFEVYKKDAVLKAEAKSVDYGETVKILVNVTADNKLGNDDNVSVTINGKKYNATVVNGEATIEIPGLVVGDYECQLTLESVNYQAQDVPVTFKVNKKEASISVNVSDVVFGETVKILVNVTADNKPVNESNVSVTINGEKYNATVVNGNATIEIPGLTVGNYSAEVIYESENYITTSQPVKFTVLQVIINAEDAKYGVNDNYTYQAKLVDEKGNPLANKSLNFTIDGKTYNATTDNEGFAIVTLSLAVGTYDVVVSYEFAENATANITVLPRVVDNSDLVMDYDNGDFKITALGDDGNPIAGETVVMKVNGVTYNIKTDDAGIASLPIELKPGTYTITSTYKGTTVKNTIKVKSTLKAVKKTVKVKKTAKKLVLKATLKLSNGKAIVGKKITFKFKGKTYKVKTNKKGIAKLKIKKKIIKKLKKGKTYKAKIIYKNETVTTKVKVKK